MMSIDDNGFSRQIQLEYLSSMKYIQIESNQHCSYYLTSEGLYSQGNWKSLLLGFKDHERLSTMPIQILFGKENTMISRISASNFHVMAVSTTG
jgi:hypothetical protein